MFYKIDICNYVKVIKSGLVRIEYFKILMYYSVEGWIKWLEFILFDLEVGLGVMCFINFWNDKIYC